MKKTWKSDIERWKSMSDKLLMISDQRSQPGVYEGAPISESGLAGDQGSIIFDFILYCVIYTINSKLKYM